MIKFDLPAKLFMAAQLFQANRDVRHYLCGVFISSEALVATNGHCMFYHERQNELSEPLILRALERIPAKAHTMQFKIETQGESFAFIRDINGILISSTVIDVISGNFPDWKRVANTKRADPEAVIGLNSSYLALVDKAVKLVGNKKYCGVEIHPGSANDQVHFKIESPELDPSNVIVMPMRL